MIKLGWTLLKLLFKMFARVIHVQGTSCVLQFIEVFEHIGRKFVNGEQIDVLYLDMSKTFDKVSHTQLLHRLRELEFRQNVLKWLSSHFSKRCQQTINCE